MVGEGKRHVSSMVLGFRMLAEKREDLAGQANKLRGGLSKIDDTRLKVNEMAAELEITHEQVYKSTRECEEFLVTIGTCHPFNVDVSSLGAFTSNHRVRTYPLDPRVTARNIIYN